MCRSADGAGDSIRSANQLRISIPSRAILRVGENPSNMKDFFVFSPFCWARLINSSLRLRELFIWVVGMRRAYER